MNRRAIVFILFILFLCFPVSSIAAEHNKKISVFGVTLGETLATAGMRECTIKKTDSRGKKDYDFNDTDCYEHVIIGETDCLTFIKKKLSFYVMIRATNATKCNIETPIEQVIAEFAADDFKQIFSLVSGKFGKPQKTENIPVGNKMGAKFNKIENIWRINDNFIYLTNMNEKIDEGILIITDAKKVKQETDKSSKNRQSDKQKF